MEIVTIENYEKLLKYFSAQSGLLTYHVDQAWLTCKTKHFNFKIHDGVLIVFRNYPDNKYEPWQIAMRPFTLDGDIDKEKHIIELLKPKYSFVLLDVDCERYEIDTSDLEDKKMSQYIYSTETYRPENLTGKKNRKWRNAVSQLESRYKIDIFKYEKPDELDLNIFVNQKPKFVLEEFYEVNRKWANISGREDMAGNVSSRKKKSSTLNLWVDTLDKIINCHIMTIRTEDGQLVAYNTSQLINDENVIYSSEKILRTEGSFSLTKGIHVKLSEYYRNLLGKEVSLNKGLSRDGGLETSKQLLRPTKIMKLYKLKHD